ncbi:integration host factor subunit beta [Dichelobacter nodosus]|uniref:Integration host factor subunit beta n=1 Tax=Dichelobacter nodosus (strain VCS1703A) TaxID=246195 RepID=IHFB_DICNV|nr:integration host factor subunit beta [Dichelobacter nodosus]A5EWQ2.1 RecName: Full=Integration host factor subunit beta; Short=IHF-beta [Dichelobacter nodosus VCS1703A]ABQ13284.1 integration host factor, beta subunit [Dichelobacter nodosus VCS1703A]AXM45043.1 integration host factor subunit beta [Dichelobacter nodosus]KNZ39731.1 integration host factor subunit beta [Dichelobacter nodosus]TGA66033.1 integration host factor subunit beta [Dichelobacter nodosus]
MTKSELIERLVMKYPQLRAQDVEDTVKLMIERICHTLEKGDRVEIRGFGSFSLHYRESRQGRNPKTGESVRVPAKSIPYFRAGKELRERVDEEINQ